MKKVTVLRNRAITKAVGAYRIDVSNVRSLKYEHALAAQGAANERREVKIGRTTFRSPGVLASTISHESEGHVNQVAAGFTLGRAPRAHFDKNKELVRIDVARTPEEIQNVLQEIKAYDWDIGNARRFGLTKKEKAHIMRSRRIHFNALSPRYKQRVRRGNMRR